MGLFGSLIGNASNFSPEVATREYGHLLASGETIEVAYKLVRDMFIFTPKRLILVDVQGMTGKKIEVKSIPYRSITFFSVETTGHFDLDAELKIWISGQESPVEKTFSKSVSIYEVQAVLAQAIAGS